MDMLLNGLQIFMLIPAFLTFLVAMMKYPDKRNLKEKGFVLAQSSRTQSIMARKSQRSFKGPTGHTAPIVEKQKAMTACAQLTLFTESRIPSPRNDAAHSG